MLPSLLIDHVKPFRGKKAEETVGRERKKEEKDRKRDEKERRKRKI